MRVAVVAGPDPGHSFPAIALCKRFAEAGDTPTLLTGVEWLETARAAGISARRTGRPGGHRRGRRRRRSAASAGRADGRAHRADAARAGTGSGGVRRHHLRRRHGRRVARDPVGRTLPASAVPAVEGPAADRQRTGAGHRLAGQTARHRDAGADRAVLACGPAATRGRPGRDRAAGCAIPDRCGG